MDSSNNAVLVQSASLKDLEAMIERAVDKQFSAFIEQLNNRPTRMLKRKDAAKLLGVSLPTLDLYARHGLLTARHVGGRVFFSEEDVLGFKGG